MDFSKIAPKEQITKTVDALKANGMNAIVVKNGEEAKRQVAELIPQDAEVMDMTSETLRTTGIADMIDNSGDYNAVKPKLFAMNRETDGNEMQKMGAAPDYAIGSVHAITEDGHVYIASNTGSQLAAYVYGSSHVVWVVGAQKLVKTADEAMKRLYDHVLPLESERAHKAYNVPGSFISKLLIINREVNPQRIHIVIVNEALGY